MENLSYQVIVIGANMLQNLALASLIETHSQWTCSAFESLNTARSQIGDAGEGCVTVLFDYNDFKDNVTEAAIAAEVEKTPADWAIALFNLHQTSAIESASIQFGVRGFFYQDDTVETLLKGIGSLFSGKLWVSPKTLAESLMNHGSGMRSSPPEIEYPKGLTRRETEILYLLVEGCSNKSIAKKLFISPDTVRTHLHRIFGKLEISSRVEASVWAAQNLVVLRDQRNRTHTET